MFPGREYPGSSGETCALLVRDSRGALACYPADNKDNASVELALRHFLGSSVSASTELYSDCAGEISLAASNIGISHQQSIPNVPMTHRKIEKRYQQALGSCRAALLQSGLPVSWWPEALSYACIAQGIADKTLVNLQPPTAKAFVLLPFGCRVSVKPAAEASSAPKFESAGKPALFLGWKLQPGLRYRGEMLYCFEDEFSPRFVVENQLLHSTTLFFQSQKHANKHTLKVSSSVFFQMFCLLNLRNPQMNQGSP